jgi:hypothetical protein
MPGGAYVDDGQPAMAQARAPSAIIEKGRCPYAFIIAPAMRYARKHCADARVRLYSYQSGNTTHDLALESAESSHLTRHPPIPGRIVRRLLMSSNITDAGFMSPESIRGLRPPQGGLGGGGQKVFIYSKLIR